MRAPRARPRRPRIPLATAGALIGLAISPPASASADDAIELARAIDARCNAIDEAARAALDREELPAADRAIGELRDCRASSPFLARSAGDLGMAAPRSQARAYDFLRRIDSLLLHGAEALAVYAHWLRGDADAVEAALAATPDAREPFADLLAGRAARRFEQQDWNEAARVYRLARERRVAAVGGWDARAGSMAFNEAMAEMNAGRPGRARETLARLARELPDHLPEQVGRARAGAILAEVAPDYGPLEERARAAFEAGDWVAAGERFAEAARFLTARGLPRSHPRVCALRHNEALARWRGGDPAAAREILAEVARDNPGYDPETVARHLRELERAADGG